MRLLAPLLVLAAIAASGCTQGDSRDGEDFTPTCPSWIEGLDKQIVDGHLLFSNTTTQPRLEKWEFYLPDDGKKGTSLGGTALEFQEYPLDIIVLDFHAEEDLANTERLLYVQDATLHLEFFRDEGGYPGDLVQAWREDQGRGSAQDLWTFESDDEAGWSMFNLTLRLDLAQPDGPADPHGVFAHWRWEFNKDRDMDTPSLARWKYAADLWYRTCNEDGSSAKLD